MKRYFGVIVAFITLVAIMVYGRSLWTDEVREVNRKLSLAVIRVAASERLAWLRVQPDDKAYRNEIVNYLRWYFKEVSDHLARFGGREDFADYLDELEERGRKGGKEERSDDKRALYDYTRRIFDLMKGGTYAPHWTGTDKGIRLDLLSASTRKVGAEERIHMPLVIWGIPREERVGEKGVRRVTASASIKFSWKLFDEKQKLIAEMSGEGIDNRIDWPDRYISFFPAGVVLGHWDIERLPTEVKSAEINFSVSTRAPTGGDMSASYVWKLDVPAEWKLGAGEAWKGATESIRPEEEINAAVKARSK